MNEGMENLKQIEDLENNMYTIDEITGAWYEAYDEYLKDEYPGFIEILEKKKDVKKRS